MGVDFAGRVRGRVRFRVVALALACAVAMSAFAADSAHIWVRLTDFQQTAMSGVRATLTPISPLPRTYGTALFARTPRSLVTDAAGTCTFSNVLWGVYRLDLAGNPGTSYTLTLSTNHSGLVSAATLATVPAAVPPNPATNYYTMSQIDALLSSQSLGLWELTADGSLTPSQTAGVGDGWETDADGNLRPL